ncbi:hypothetical protein ONA70_34040, partial [Micromonospora yasonensis]|uniref:hypothetical protein n=1 Tax=Micromonospora yasonensis TaxID=1128667 RepID=UPI00222E474E
TLLVVGEGFPLSVATFGASAGRAARGEPGTSVGPSVVGACWIRRSTGGIPKSALLDPFVIRGQHGGP